MKSLREWRLEKLLGVKNLAAESGVSTKTIVQIEHGRQLPRLRTIRRLCEVLDVQPAEVEEFKAALDELGKDPAVIEPRPDGYPVDAATSAGPLAV
jgi:transcriptional regulator with XRE-family HTH domain